MNATPLTLADNLFENHMLYPGHAVEWSSEVAHHEGFRAFDGLRDLSWWEVASTLEESVQVQCDEARAADMIVLDRGHNLTGRTLTVERSADGAAWTQAFSGSVGSAGTVTAEGAWWSQFPSASAAFWRVRIAGGAAPARITGLWLGKALSFRNYLHRPVDPDRAERHFTERRTEGGVLVRGMIVTHRILDDRLTLYDEAEYAAGVRKWVIQTTRGNVPWWWCLDSTNAPTEMWQFLAAGTMVEWPFEQAKSRTGRIRGIENIPLRTLLYL